MGGTSYSDAVYRSAVTDKLDKGIDVFSHDVDVKAGRATTLHEKVDPKKTNTVGKIIRESFDSDIHPTSRAVSVLFDVTGSMHTVPTTFVSKLNKLMALLVKKSYLEHPHILFGAIGDATCDKYPLQVGQFEGGNEMDEALTSMIREGGGGGHVTESYELAMFFMARYTDMDCVKKRGEKAYLFLCGDEIPYSQVKRSQVKEFIGVDIQHDIPTEEILAELREKFEVFWIIPGGTAHFNDPQVNDPLRAMFGQNLLKLENPDDVCELIASTIGVNEGYDLHDVASALKDIGADAGAVGRSSSALTVYASNKAVTKGAVASGALATAGGSDSVDRL